MKATVQVKDEPVDVSYSNDTVNELLRLYGYTLTDPSAAKALKTTSPRTTKSTLQLPSRHAAVMPTTKSMDHFSRLDSEHESEVKGLVNVVSPR